ncbi:exosortase family protein XrtF [Flavobacterium nitrogenifigens]|uniref:Exosortase family protein XrtF n=1 Tax=Flavobacterium nitrogenifigens TaxID=1617283 RepID=A0A521CCA7_9FLAO|nr:exosortase family protein XrtF [Flavobacterium nitrogenifigens]KAF2327073.1 exosortase family protein XrtF [Flavobacterium nitrogenifigens]SMO57059.1 exosortase family protein XrtF [Flavobacterium nitrogenifigens]
MKKYLVQFKPFLIFISIFFLTYIVLMSFYKLYLDSYQAEDLDAITMISGKNSEQLLKLFNYDVIIQKSSQNPWQEIILNGMFIARITEGCNAVSVMILFVAFVAAFSGNLKKTLLFIMFGVVSIYILNVIRISLLIVLVYHFPQYSHFLHGTLFPLMIYGYVFILWIFWINRFSKYAK